MTKPRGTADGKLASGAAITRGREGRVWQSPVREAGAARGCPDARPCSAARKRLANAVAGGLLLSALGLPPLQPLLAAESGVPRTAVAGVSGTVGSTAGSTAGGTAEEALRGFSFGVIGNLPRSEAETGVADTVLASLALGDVAFVIDAGNIKGADEICSDRLYERRYDWLQRAPLPVIFLPGENDWIACEYLGADASDPVQRLDALRARFFPDSRSLGAMKLPVSRQSSYAGFHAYRENTRWRVGGVTFATLNVAGMNNHYVRDGGRNGEFEDRTVANRVWLERTVALARRDRSRALVIVVGVNPWSSAPRGRMAAMVARVDRRERRSLSRTPPRPSEGGRCVRRPRIPDPPDQRGERRAAAGGPQTDGGERRTHRVLTADVRSGRRVDVGA